MMFGFGFGFGLYLGLTSGAGGGEQIYFEDWPNEAFDEAFSHTGALDTFDGWTRISGSAAQALVNSAGALDTVDTSSDGTLYLSSQLTTDLDHYAEGVVGNSEASISSGPVLAVRIIDANNWCGVRYVRGGTTGYQIIQSVAGTVTVKATYATTVNVGDVFRLVSRDDQVRLHVNGGAAVASVTLTSNPSTGYRQGLVARSRAMAGWITRFKSGLYANIMTVGGADKQTFMGSYIEIQSDSYSGTGTPPMDAVTDLWGFPWSLTASERARVKRLLFNGDKLLYIRLPLGFAYRGPRNVDGTSGLAKNFGERWVGQNSTLADMLSDVLAFGGLAPEYWSPAPHWKTTSSVGGGTLWAGAAYSRATSLDSIRDSDPSQYAAQIDALTSAMLDDLEYLHVEIAPIRMFGLQNEPAGSAAYGGCSYTDQIYADVWKSIIPKIRNSSVLSTYGGQANSVLLHADSQNGFQGSVGVTLKGDATVLSTGKTAFQEIWAGTVHDITAIGTNAGYVATSAATYLADGKPHWHNEFEYFDTTLQNDAWRCCNTMMQMILNLSSLYAPVVMPIIHLLKPLGQESVNSNTLGYGLLKARLPPPFGEDPSTPGDENPGVGFGEFTPVPPNYNAAQLMFKMPVSSIVRDLTGDFRRSGEAWCAFYTPSGKLGLFFINRNANVRRFSVNVGNRAMIGHRYSSTIDGQRIGPDLSGDAIFHIRAYEGQVWIEQ